MPAARSLAFACCALAALGGCGPKAKHSAASAESHAPGTTMASAPAACAAYPAGAPGVIRTFCDGPATIKLNVDGAEHELKGGSCQTGGGVFSLNLGVVAGPDLAGPRPDYVGLATGVASGPFSGAVLSLTIDGKPSAIVTNSGEIGPAGGSFSGMGPGGKPKVTATFTC
jgi:hypothetical protein